MPDAFDTACALLRRYTDVLVTRDDSADQFYLDTPHAGSNGAPLFGSVTRARSGVGVHLMPVYTDPGLLDALPPVLRARMSVKPCLAFRTLNATQVAALAALVDVAVDGYRAHGHIISA